MSAPLCPLHAALREATRNAHQRLDRHPLIQEMLALPPQRNAYARMLAAQQGFYATLEPLLLTALARLALPFDYTARQKLPALQRDLAVLAQTPCRTAFGSLILVDVSDVIAALYLIEGATLGGATIARHIQAHASDWPVTFYQGYGTATAHYWQAFWEFAAAHCPPSRITPVIARAVVLFARLERHLTTCAQELADL